MMEFLAKNSKLRELLFFESGVSTSGILMYLAIGMVVFITTVAVVKSLDNGDVKCLGQNVYREIGQDHDLTIGDDIGEM